MALAPNGDLYMATNIGLVAITPSTQAQRLVLAGDDTPGASLAIDATGVVYMGVQTKSVVAIRPDDTILFHSNPRTTHLVRELHWATA